MSKITRVARIVGCVMLALGTLELLARVDDYNQFGASIFSRYEVANLTMQTPLGLTLRPNGSYGKWKVNGFGTRGPDPREGTVRIVCLGVSETFGVGEDPGREYPRQLEEQLNRKLGTRSIEVLNLGVPGGASHDTLTQLPDILARFHPAVVTLYPSPASYIWRLVRWPGPAAIELPAPQPALKGPHTISVRIRRRLRQVEEMLMRKAHRGIAFAREGWRRLTHLNLNAFRVKPKIDRLIAKALPPDANIQWTRWSTNRVAKELGITPLDRLPDSIFALYRNDLIATVELLRQHGVPVVFGTHTQRFGKAVIPEERLKFMDWWAYYAPLKEDGFFDMEQRANQVMREVAREYDVPLVEADSAMTPGPHDFADAVHFTNQGAEKMATMFAEKLTPLVEQAIRSQSAPSVP